ncbi:hypothetical protein BGW42_004570 [Actinomortierella wolfii]|nr:hypothetical protein BGW42_004570 [Actinomortierella wolfii]KAG0226016.1 hypothetical protein BGW41_004433 [Actinomortierella wolfii]
MATATVSSQPRLTRPFQMLLFLLTYVAVLLQVVHAADPYTFRLPTAATRWVLGQPGSIILVSTRRSTDKPGMLKMTLRKPGILFTPTTVATIIDGFQLFIPDNTTQAEATREIQWTVPANVAPGNEYYLHVQESGIFAPSGESPKFSIMAAAPGTNTTTGLPTPTLATPTAPPTPTATTPSCEDIQQQCAAQARIYNPPTDTAPCACGSPIPQPKVRFGTAATSVPLPPKSSSGAVAALVILVMALVGLF